MSDFQAYFMALMQGTTELFPVSSLGHAVIIPALLGWTLHIGDNAYLTFLVWLHLGTGLALLLYFQRDWIQLLGSALGRGPVQRQAGDRRLLLLLVLGTIPAVLLGAGLQSLFRALFGTPLIAAGFLVLNGLILLYGERLRQASGSATLGTLSIRQALLIGLAQATALFPGISRSGVTMVAGLRAGLTHDQSARFSFLLATPIILAAGVFKLPKAQLNQTMALAGIIAGVAAYATVAFMMRYFGRHEFKALRPFGLYCLGFGILSLALLSLNQAGYIHLNRGLFLPVGAVLPLPGLAAAG